MTDVRERVDFAEDSWSDALALARASRRKFLEVCTKIPVDVDALKSEVRGEERVMGIYALHSNAIAVLKIGGSYRDFAVYIIAGDEVGKSHVAAAQLNSGDKTPQELGEMLFPGLTNKLYRAGLIWRA